MTKKEKEIVQLAGAAIIVIFFSYWLVILAKAVFSTLLTHWGVLLFLVLLIAAGIFFLSRENRNR